MSEPPSKILKLGGDDFEHVNQNADQESIEFSVRFCTDVLLELLNYGDRRQLTKVEHTGRRLHRLIENFFETMPLLHLDLFLYPNRERFTASICVTNRKDEIISDAELATFDTCTFPCFLRFNTISVSYNRNPLSGEESSNKEPQSIEEMGLLCTRKLGFLAGAFNDINLVIFNGKINREVHNCFTDHTQLLGHIRNEFLPICGSPHGYKFEINFISDPWTAPNVIAALLQMPQIDQCSNVHININMNIKQTMLKMFNMLSRLRFYLTKLDIEAIANWLQRQFDVGTGKSGQNHRERCLQIKLPGLRNTGEICSYLKEAFTEAEHPLIPFTAIFGYFDRYRTLVELGTFLNEKTGEQLTIKEVAMDQNVIIEIKRGKQMKSQL